MHTTGDGLVVPENEQAYQQAAQQAGDQSMLRQIFVHRAGHCAFTPAETITAVQTLLNRLGTGHWNQAALTPAALNARAAALGPADNIHLLNRRQRLRCRTGVPAVPAAAGTAPVQPPRAVSRRGRSGRSRRSRGGPRRGYQMRARVGVTRITCG